MVTRSLTFSSCAVLNHFGLEGHPVGAGSPHIDPGPDSLATIRSSLPIARVFRQKQCFVVRVDYAGKHNSACTTFEAVALESGAVHQGNEGPIKRRSRLALGTYSNERRILPRMSRMVIS